MPVIKDIPYPQRGGSLTGFEVPPDRLKQALGWMQTEMPIEMVIGVNASIWMLNVDSFRGAVESLPEEAWKLEQTLIDHRSFLSMLINEGEQFIFMAKKSNLTNLPSGFTVADLEATLETLHIAFKCQHRKSNNPKVGELVESLLNGA